MEGFPRVMLTVFWMFLIPLDKVTHILCFLSRSFNVPPHRLFLFLNAISPFFFYILKKLERDELGMWRGKKIRSMTGKVHKIYTSQKDYIIRF